MMNIGCVFLRYIIIRFKGCKFVFWVGELYWIDLSDEVYFIKIYKELKFFLKYC